MKTLIFSAAFIFVSCMDGGGSSQSSSSVLNNSPTSDISQESYEPQRALEEEVTELKSELGETSHELESSELTALVEEGLLSEQEMQELSALTQNQ